MPDLHQTPSRSRLSLGWLLAGAILIGLAGAQALAENGEGQASPNEATASNEPDAAGPTVSNEPAAEVQKLLCMWRNQGVTGFCAVEPETPVGASCACREIIEHKARKFSGKVIVAK
jgi:hypothetical protein